MLTHSTQARSYKMSRAFIKPSATLAQYQAFLLWGSQAESALFVSERNGTLPGVSERRLFM